MKRHLRSIATGLANGCLDFCAGLLHRAHPEWSARAWSNRELRRFGDAFEGDIINVGAWKDGDKEGGRYRDYFPRARSYTIANYGGTDGASGLPDEKPLDLSVPYDGRHGQFDVVFSHTVIEHVFPAPTVLDNLAQLSRDCVVTVVPFLQCLHGRDGAFDDYWRYTPFSLRLAFEARGFQTLYCSWNDDHPLMNVYLFHVASRHPERHAGRFPPQPRPVVGVYGPGVSFSQLLFGDGPRRRWTRRVGERVGTWLCAPPRKGSS